jgi:hypothetical protein
MSRHEIHDPLPSIYLKCFELPLQFKLLLRNYSLHIESTSICHFNSEHIVHPPRSSLFDGEPHCLSYMSLPSVEDLSGRGPVGRDLVSRF